MMLCLLSTPRQLVLSVVVVCGLLFISSSSSLSSSLVVSAEEEEASLSLSLRAVPGDERYQRRKTWDAFGFLMMMVGGGPGGDCGPLGSMKVHIPDHGKCNECMGGNTNSCNTLCSMKSQSHKSQYSNFCASESTTITSSAESSDVNSYTDNTAPGSVTTEGNYSKGFQFWMVATAASVGLALVAIHLGQRKERETDPYPDYGGDNDNESLSSSYSGGANARGSVGLRLAAVSAFADGMMPNTTHTTKQVELSEYQLDDTPQSPPSYPQSALV